jgi:hypothetical protein
LKLPFFGSIENFMSLLVDQITQAGLSGHVLNERQLARVIGGSDPRRYGLVNRALKDGSLVRVKRGTYLLGSRYRPEPVHPFAIAQRLVPGSYVSFETALAWHGWIPEGVFVTASASPGRKTLQYETPGLGTFSFHPLAIKDFQFLAAIDRVEVGKRAAFIAQPLRALLDLVEQRKLQWQGSGLLTEGMRIEEEQLASLRQQDFDKLRSVYKHRTVNAFMNELESAVTALGTAGSFHD